MLSFLYLEENLDHIPIIKMITIKPSKDNTKDHILHGNIKYVEILHIITSTMLIYTREIQCTFDKCLEDVGVKIWRHLLH